MTLNTELVRRTDSRDSDATLQAIVSLQHELMGGNYNGK